MPEPSGNFRDTQKFRDLPALGLHGARLVHAIAMPTGVSQVQDILTGQD